MDWQYSKHMVPVARDLRREMTVAEGVLWEMLRGRRCGGWRFVRQAPVGPFVLDFYCPWAKLAVEADGDVHLVPSVAKRDTDRQAILEQEFGIIFVRFTNDAVIKSPATVSASISVACQSAQANQQNNPNQAHRRVLRPHS